MITKRKYRYWVYLHTKEGDLIDYAQSEVDTLSEAVVDACEFLGNCTMNDVVARIVDLEDDATTVWIAGPVSVVLKGPGKPDQYYGE